MYSRNSRDQLELQMSVLPRLGVQLTEIINYHVLGSVHSVRLPEVIHMIHVDFLSQLSKHQLPLNV